MSLCSWMSSRERCLVAIVVLQYVLILNLMSSEANLSPLRWLVLGDPEEEYGTPRRALGSGDGAGGVICDSATTTTTSNTKHVNAINVTDTCRNLPTIRPSGVFFANKNLKMRQSNAGVEPKYFYASDMQIRGHHDAPLFQLMRERFGDKDDLIAFDVGANRGLYTWYIASLGFEVHAFEINARNFMLLEHGALFNEKKVADRTRMYQMGLSDAEGRVGMQDTEFRGYLSNRSNPLSFI